MISAVAGSRTAGPAVRRWREQRMLLRTTVSLLATTGITTGLGLAFWWLAAVLP